MKTEKLFYRNVIVVFALLLFVQGISQEKENLITRKKVLVKEFKEKNVSNLFITNSFGDINVSIWDKEYIEMTITTEVAGWNNEEVDIFFDQILPNPTYENNQITSTINFKNIKNVCCKDAIKSYRPWFGKNASVKHFRINYSIKIPKSTNYLQLLNSYGNISLPSYSGKLHVSLKNGNLKAGNLNLTSSECTDIVVRYGTVNLGDVNNASLYLYSCDFVKIGKIEESSLITSFSNVQLGNASGVKLNSKSDIYKISVIDSLDGRGQFTTISTDYLDSYMKFKNQSGEVEIKEISPDFNSVLLDGQFNHYALQVSNLNYSLSASLESTELRCDESICSESFKNKAMNESITFTKKIGHKLTFSRISLSCTNCNIDLIE